MFFGLIAVDDHPCCKMQEAVETFFRKSVKGATFSSNLFPSWLRSTIRVTSSTTPLAPQNAGSVSSNRSRLTLGDRFQTVHNLLHGKSMNPGRRKAIYEQLRVTNQIEELCNGDVKLPRNVIDWQSNLGVAIADLMSALYGALDLQVFRKPGVTLQPTHQLYAEFIEKNKYVCPFCGLDQFKNRRGPTREDFDHYLHRSAYPLAAANMKNLVPTCGTCNQDYKSTRDILDDGAAFYPYGPIPEVKIEIECLVYPVVGKTSDTGSWEVRLELVAPDPVVAPKMKTWNRVYSIKTRLENEIHEYFEDWMTEVTDGQCLPVNHEQFLDLIALAKVKAAESSKRRMKAGQIIRAAFFDFMLSKAKHSFVDSFRKLQNGRYLSS